MKHITFFTFCFLLLNGVLVAYSYVKTGNITRGEAEGHIEEVKPLLEEASWSSVFQNNLLVYLVSLVNIFGLTFLLLALCNTGNVFASVSLIAAVNPVDMFVELYRQPFIYFEIAGFTVAVYLNLLLLHRTVTCIRRGDPVRTVLSSVTRGHPGKTVVFGAFTLLIAAFMEMGL